MVGTVQAHTLWQIGETVVCILPGSRISPGDHGMICDIQCHPHTEQLLLQVEFSGRLEWVQPHMLQSADQEDA